MIQENSSEIEKKKHENVLLFGTKKMPVFFEKKLA